VTGEAYGLAQTITRLVKSYPGQVIIICRKSYVVAKTPNVMYRLCASHSLRTTNCSRLQFCLMKVRWHGNLNDLYSAMCVCDLFVICCYNLDGKTQIHKRLSLSIILSYSDIN